MKLGFVLNGAVVAVLLFGAVAPPAAADEVLGKLGGVELSGDQVKQMLDGMNPEVKARLAASKVNLGRFISLELVQEKLASEARAKGWDKRPEVVEAAERAKEQVIISYYLNSFLQPGNDYPSDDQVNAFYEANKKRFLTPGQYHVAQIYLSLSRGAGPAVVEEMKKKAEDIVEQARDGADFAALAKKNSDHRESASHGGDAGWVAENRLLPEARAALKKLAVDEISDPIKTVQGWHILKLLGTRPPKVRPLDQMRAAIVAELRVRKTQANEVKYRRDLVTKTPPVINEAELTKLWNSIKP